MEIRNEKMIGYFEEQIRLCSQRSNALRSDGRTDEATFEKVRGNIYDIFRTVFLVAEDTCKGEPEKAAAFFIQRLEQIPSSWVTSLEKAREHDDEGKVQLEQLKLDTAAQIRANFEAIWEGAR